MSRISVKVVIDDAHLDAQDAVRRAVSAMGLRIEECMPEIGTFFGSAEEGVVERIAQVNGVARAQAEAGYRLPPFDPAVPQ